ncbi:hypothetical protein SAMN02745857_04171 [Andreprevotia lacus DSM 23236]|jgi:predicted anti-sigma-YlaC factor YlaD|uniref:Zinc-finger n=1 Tax=Andreprevotia lacus DSM 23236 TaxID=1121001 RepID=A0A1W1Y0T5_9NEIS|nr:hypothetical protein [Andreprevotia lacus]SMC29830.1 hypothetical protein SAMN02745857_04171 [Andreprevotia lacus DSM 23236]
MANCKKVSRLISDAQDRPLKPGEWLLVKTHLPICSNCRNYRNQIAVLQEATRQLRDGEALSMNDDLS